MKVLVIGSGGREYAIGLGLKNDSKVSHIYFAPGNGATHLLGTNVSYNDYNELVLFVKNENINLTIVGPEQPLSEGVVDIFRSHNLVIFGPTASAARLEGSKIFMKKLLQKYNIPTARFIETSSLAEATNFIHTLNAPIVVKADGLCAGKGVIIAQSHHEANEAAKEMLSGEAFGQAGSQIVIEEFLDGYELSVFAITDGKEFITLPVAQDHKRLLTGDQGPNTGGMGAYAPTPLCDNTLMEKINQRIIKPTIHAMEMEGSPFQGVLFGGIMVVNNEPITLEFNVRFGDPECEELMALWNGSLYDLFEKASTGKLHEIETSFTNEYAVGVVLASKNYPYKNSEPTLLTTDDLSGIDGHVCYAGVSQKDGLLYASGGRVCVCVGKGLTIKEATHNAYELAKRVHFDGKQYRTDIAWQVLRD